MSEGESLTIVLLREIRDEMKTLRAELGDVQRLSLSVFDRVKRLERRLEETRDDLETTIKAEIMGARLNWCRSLEDRLAAIETELSSPRL
jgi:predicted nuclease with TOPRIM domain